MCHIHRVGSSVPVPVQEGLLSLEIPRHTRVYRLLLWARPVVPIPVVLQGFTGRIVNMPSSSIAALRCLLAQLHAFLVSRDEFLGLRLVFGNSALLPELRNLFLIVRHSVLLKPATHCAMIMGVIAQ
jgi:hypothetical protein